MFILKLNPSLCKLYTIINNLMIVNHVSFGDISTILLSKVVTIYTTYSNNQ
jgi:hypothetical protein